MFHLRKDYHHILYIVSLCFVVFSLPFYEAMSSIGIIVMAVNWLLEGSVDEKLRRLRKNPGIWIIASFYLTGILGAIYSEDFRQVIRHLQNGLAFFIIPLIIGTSKPLKELELRYLVLSGAVSVVINSIVSYMIFLNWLDIEITNYRHYSYFSSNVHLSYLAIVVVLTLFYFVARRKAQLPKRTFYLYIGLIIWISVYIYFLRSFSGILIFLVLVWMVLLKRTFLMSTKTKYLIAVLLFILPLVPFYVFNNIYNDNFTEYAYNTDTLARHTVNGNKYTHKTGDQLMENGRYVGLYICEKELKKEWNETSELSYEGKDKKGQPLNKTLIRYLTARHLKKDSVGFSHLTNQDIRNVENGMTNPIYQRTLGLYPRLYTLAQSIYYYKKTGKPFDSFTKRFEAYNAMISIFTENPVIGVGPGDIKEAYRSYYDKKFENAETMDLVGGHNQYLKILAAFGLLGFAWFLFSFLGSWIIHKGWKHFLSQMLLVAFLIAMISEVSLDQQRPAILFSIFYSLFLFGLKENRLR